MNPVNRKEFLHTTALALAGLVVGSSFDLRRKNLLLSFSTLGCPDWTLQQITDFAVQHGYKGIEVRGLLRQMDLTRCPEFHTEENRKETLALMKQKGLQFVGLGSSANLHVADEAEKEKNLHEAKRFIDLAGQLNCPYVRVFPNNLPKEEDKKQTLNRIAQHLLELGNYAKEKNVTVLMETHGDVVWIEDLKTVMQAASHSHVGLVWDVSNMWTITKEPPAQAFRQLKRYIRHTHIKDARLVEGKPQYTLLGRGDVPIFEAIDALRNGNYKGYYSFEWEKLWQPGIAEPEIAIADYPLAMKKHIKSL